MVEIVSLSSCCLGDGVSDVEVIVEVHSELVGVTDILLFSCVPDSAWHFEESFLRLRSTSAAQG